jgi:hypothetical protein
MSTMILLSKWTSRMPQSVVFFAVTTLLIIVSYLVAISVQVR